MARLVALWRKSGASEWVPVPQTDTGSRGEESL